MIVLFNPRSTKPRHRRHPYSILALAAVLPEDESMIVDGNVDPDPVASMARAARKGGVDAFGFTVMPGPQLVAAVEAAKKLKNEFPRIPMIWGGYFPSLYTRAVLSAPYVDYAIRGQGEGTLVELLEAIRSGADEARLGSIKGLSWKSGEDRVSNAERIWEGPDSFPPVPFDRVRGEDYVSPTHLGQRTAAYFTSIGCPYKCNFCGVITMYGNRETFESVDRTEQALRWLVQNHGIDSVHFIDNNFFLREDHARELVDRITPLGLSWWCEARIDVGLSFSDDTWRRIAGSGCRMIFFGVESGSDENLRRMNKSLTTAQSLEMAARIRRFGIVPEFSFCLGDPGDPEKDILGTLRFIRRVKEVNPDTEIVLYFYHPTPQRNGMYGGLDGDFEFPEDLDVWCTKEWLDFQTHTDSNVPWIGRGLKELVDGFDEVQKARFPSVHDDHVAPWGRRVLRALAGWRWDMETYSGAAELALVRRLARIPRDLQEYGHFRG